MSATTSPSEPSAKPQAANWLRKYFNIFRASLVERMAYRLDFVLSTFLRFLPMLTTILLWQAVYASARAWALIVGGAGTAGIFATALGQGPLLAATAVVKTEIDTNPNIKGYTLANMVAYLLLVHISRMFSSMPGLAHSIARDIRDGNLKKYLLQPIEMLPYLLSYRIAHKAAYIATSAVPYAVLFGLCHQYFTLPANPWTWLAYFVSLVLGFIIGFYFEACIGMVGFWFLEVTSFLYVIGTVTFFVSGHMFPLDLLPGPVAAVLKLLPFNYLAYFPATVFLERITGNELLLALALEATWALIFVIAAHVLYRLGLRRYSAYGG